MKKAKLLLTSLLAVSFITSCNPTTPSTSPSTSPSSSITTPSSSSSSTVTPSSSSSSTIEHRKDFVTELADGAVLRDYKSQFDTMVNDFSSDSFVGETTGKKIDKSYLKVLVDSQTESFPSNDDASIYKMATGNYQIETYSTINFRMRVTEGKLDYSNLVLALRGDDAFNVYEISLDKALNDDGDALPELGNEFVDVCISPNYSIEDADTKYTLKGTSDPSDVNVLSKILGFHLYAKGECSAVLEIEEVSISLAGEKTVLDDFNRTNVNKADQTCWWRGSKGFIVTKGVNLKDNQTYQTPEFDLADNTEVVLNILGDTTGTSISPVTESGIGTAVNWKDLKNKDGENIVNAVNGAYYNLAINLEKSGLSLEGLKGFVIQSTSEINISAVFLSSLKEKEAATSYPLIDTANAVIFDSFSRTQAKIDTDYNESTLNEKVTGAGLNYSVCYSGVDDVTIDGDALVFSPTENYTQVNEGSKNARTNEKYLVMSMKVDGGDLNGLRIQSSNGGDAIYAPNWYAAEGLKTIPTSLEEYPYVDADGYAFYIIDLSLSGLGDMKDILNIYYTGTGTLKIDSIFFAGEYLNLEKVPGYCEEKTLNLSGYTYALNTAVTENTRFVEFTIKGDGVATFNSFRLEFNGNMYFCKDNPWVLKDGTKITGETIIPEEKTSIVIDLLASGITPAAETMHLHTGGDGEQGTATIYEMFSYNLVDYSETLGGYNGSSSSLADYAYLGGGDIKADAKYLELTLSSNNGGTLASLRFEGADAALYFFNQNVIKDDEGNVIDPNTVIPTEGLTIKIDLKATGLTLDKPFSLHLHSGDPTCTGDLKVEGAKVIYEHYPYSMLLASYVENPTL